MFFRVTEPMGCACVLYVYIYYMMICFIYVDSLYTHTHICYEDLAHMIMEVKFQFCHLQAGDPGKLEL